MPESHKEYALVFAGMTETARNNLIFRRVVEQMPIRKRFAFVLEQLFTILDALLALLRKTEVTSPDDTHLQAIEARVADVPFLLVIPSLIDVLLVLYLHFARSETFKLLLRDANLVFSTSPSLIRRKMVNFHYPDIRTLFSMEPVVPNVVINTSNTVECPSLRQWRAWGLFTLKDFDWDILLLPKRLLKKVFSWRDQFITVPTVRALDTLSLMAQPVSASSSHVFLPVSNTMLSSDHISTAYTAVTFPFHVQTPAIQDLWTLLSMHYMHLDNAMSSCKALMLKLKPFPTFTLSNSLGATQDVTDQSIIQ
jgi:hypothetical protein